MIWWLPVPGDATDPETQSAQRNAYANGGAEWRARNHFDFAGKLADVQARH